MRRRPSAPAPAAEALPETPGNQAPPPPEHQEVPETSETPGTPESQESPAAPAEPGGWIAIGRVSGLFGPHGEVRVRPAGRFPQRFRELRQIYLGERHEPATILHRRIYRSGNQDGVVLRLDLLRTREAARERIGQYVFVPETDAVPLPPGEYFVHQIVGLAVRTVAGEDLGKVVEVLQTGSNDVYVVRGRRGEVLLPATKEVIKEVDLEGGALRVEPLPGLIEDTPPAEPPPPAAEPPAGPPAGPPAEPPPPDSSP